MRIAITSTGPSPDALVDPRFGRAGFVVVFDTETGEFTVLDNAQALNSAHGAGIKAAEMLSQLGVEVVITGNCGPKALVTLETAGIKVVTGATGTVREVLEKFRRGELGH
jgi:predicted Fe-Mo cluster-binding NifX family protein